MLLPWNMLCAGACLRFRKMKRKYHVDKFQASGL